MRMPPYRILLIDDDEFVCDVVRRSFSAPLYTVKTLDGPMGATNTAREFQPDIVLLDMHLPAVTGNKLIALMRGAVSGKNALGGRTLFFLYSADCESELRRISKEHSFDGYFTKDTPLATMEKKLRSMITGTRPTSPPM